jgi:glycosyltransferase involved in cell wall biosynthesis
VGFRALQSSDAFFLLFPFGLVYFPHFNVPFWYPKKFIVTIHDLILLRYPTLRNTTRPAWLYSIKFLAYRAIIALAIRRAAHVITVSHFTEKDILKRYSGANGKISVTYEAVDQWCQLLPEQEEWKLFDMLGLLEKTAVTEEQKMVPLKISRDILKSYLLYVGNAYPHKNLEALVRAAPFFPEQTFVLVGKEDHFYHRLRKMAEQQRVQNVVFAGFIDDRGLSALYRFATCYLFPSLYEGFGLPPLEAMARGLPVLSSDQGSLPEILGDAARYFNPHRNGSLEKELAEILASETVRKDLLRRGYVQAARYSWETMARETLALYRQVDREK